MVRVEGVSGVGHPNDGHVAVAQHLLREDLKIKRLSCNAETV